MNAITVPYREAPALALKRASPTVLRGFGLSLGLTLAYLSLVVLIPLAALFVKTATLGLSGF